jgi:hypothetical protein
MGQPGQRSLTSLWVWSSGTFTSTQMFYLIYQDRVDWLIMYINVREYRRGNKKWKIQRNWQHRVHKTGKKHKKTQHKCVGHRYITQTNTNTVNKTRSLLQTTGGKGEPNIVLCYF